MIERQRDPRYSRTLVGFIAASTSSAREENARAIGIRHLAKHLPREYNSALDSLGYDYAILENAPLGNTNEVGLRLDSRAREVLMEARRKAKSSGVDQVTVDHVGEAILDTVDFGLSAEFRFLKGSSAPIKFEPADKGEAA